MDTFGFWKGLKPSVISCKKYSMCKNQCQAKLKSNLSIAN